VNRVVYDVTSKSPGTSEGEYRGVVSIAEARANPLLSSIVRDLPLRRPFPALRTAVLH